MIKHARETVEVRGDRASNCCMDLGNQEEDAKREAPADAGRCQTCQLTIRVVIAMATTILVTGLILCFIIFATWTRAPEVDPTSNTSKEELLVTMERLQQCQQEHRDVDLMLHTVTRDSRCSLCPGGWRWWRSHCYFFSVGLQEDRPWNESAEFCLQQNSRLAVIKGSAEMEFIQSVMRKFPHLPFPWIGLTDAEQEGRWLWVDGTDIQHYMPVTLEWDADHRDCADLRGGGRLFAASCEAYAPWLCKRDS